MPAARIVRGTLLLAGLVGLAIAPASASAPPKTAADDAPPAAGLAKITHLKIAPRRFKVGPAKNADIALSSRAENAAGATLTFTLSAKSHLVVRAYQLMSGRRHGKVCVPGRKAGPPCQIYAFHHGTDHYDGLAGDNTVTFSGRLAGKKLAPGKYKLVLTPYEGSKTGKPASVKFTIIR